MPLICSRVYMTQLISQFLNFILEFFPYYCFLFQPFCKQSKILTLFTRVTDLKYFSKLLKPCRSTGNQKNTIQKLFLCILLRIIWVKTSNFTSADWVLFSESSECLVSRSLSACSFNRVSFSNWSFNSIISTLSCLYESVFWTNDNHFVTVIQIRIL